MEANNKVLQRADHPPAIVHYSIWTSERLSRQVRSSRALCLAYVTIAAWTVAPY